MSSNDTPMANVNAKGARYRASCDYCQKIKVRCSQGKPACTRCVNKAIPCVYSPVRRMGRPRKMDHQFTPSHDATHEDETEMVTGVTPDHREGHTDSGFSSGHYISTGPSSVTSPSISSTPITVQTTQPQHLRCSDTANPTSLGDYGHPSSGYTETPWSHSLHSVQAGDEDANPKTDHNYLAILNTLATLEQSTANLQTLPVDLVLRAERDFRVLAHRILDRAGGESKPQTHLSLALLAERVVSMLEGIFGAAISTLSARLTTMDVPPPENEQVRRFERSFRGFMGQPCVFPVPGGSSNIRFGLHGLSMPATARAIKAILQMRLRKMRVALLDMQGELRRQSQTEVDTAKGVLDWGNSDSSLRASSGDVVQSLIKRLESLQGAMVLMG